MHINQHKEINLSKSWSISGVTAPGLMENREEIELCYSVWNLLKKCFFSLYVRI